MALTNTTLTDTERVQLLAQLVELQAAYDRLISGGNVASVGSGGRSVGYSPGNATAILVRITEIKRQLGLGSGRFSFRPHF